MTANSLVELEQQEAVARVWLNRPEIRNAFNPAVISELRAAFERIAGDDSIRVVVIGGRGKVFCAGADLTWMREMASYTEQQNLDDALALAGMLREINACPKPVIARVQRAAFGGALGLMACCDYVISADDSVFSFSEVRLGISPATIAPYVMNKTSAGFCRAVMLSGRRFGPEYACSSGLVDRVVDGDKLDEAVESEVNECLMAAPTAAAETKALINNLQSPGDDEVIRRTAELIARLRVSSEGQEGLKAFLEKRQPEWQAGEAE